ncbi:MAG TPA: orotate phosphoribosyltransferase, partial [Armatimonadota bacterium]|nr:orotate phosphoribosyltransferase [Armatimonadota bacterium]
TDIAKLADALYEAGCIRFGEFTLKDGSIAPIYIDLRVLVGEPKTLRLLASMIAERLGEFEFDVITGIPYAALPIGVAVSLEADLPLVYARDKPKAYGTRHQVEGKFEEGQRVLVIDDVITSGGSKVEAAEPLRAAGLVVEDVLVVIDREQGGGDVLKPKGLKLHAMATITELLEYLGASGKVSQEQIATALDFVSSRRHG